MQTLSMKTTSTNMINLIKQFKKRIYLKNRIEQQEGMLPYNNVDNDTCFIFVFPNEKEMRVFHTHGMKYSINIFFFDSNFNLVKKYCNCKPGRIWPCKSKSKYVVEFKEKCI